MKNNLGPTPSSRREFLKQVTLSTGSLLMSPAMSKGFDFFISHYNAEPLNVVVLGDSAMWGQGLSEKQKYSKKSVDEIGQLLKRPTKIVVNSLHSLG